MRRAELSDTVEEIYDSAFRDCVSLTSVTATHVWWIGGNAFDGCSSLKTVDFPAIGGPDPVYNGVYVIDYAFNGCVSLEEISLGGTAFLHERCFAGCIHLKSIVIEREIQVLQNAAFEGCTALEEFPLEMLSDFQIRVLEYEEQSPDYSRIFSDRVFQNCTGLVSITFPEWVWWVPSSMFRGCTDLQEVVLPEGLQTIKSAAFAGCTGIARLEIPSTVTEIHPSAFLGWTEEQTIVVSDAAVLPEEMTNCAARIEVRGS